MTDLPKYRCHKEVQALQIWKIFALEANSSIVLSGTGLTVKVSSEWYGKHNPMPGGYYVECENGDASYLPAEAFEAGYTLIEEESK